MCWPACGWAGSAGCRTAVVLQLVPAHWWEELGPSSCGCRTLGVSGLVPAHWCVGLGPGPCVGQGRVQGQLWAQGFLRQPACWWVGLCPCLVSCLTCGIPVLVPTGCWAGARLGPEADKLEGGFQNDACQHQCPCGRTTSLKWPPPVSVSPG